MVKKRIIVFCMLIFALFSLVACSDNEISKIEIIDNTIKTEYIVGEDLEINEFKLKITYENKKEVIYDITKDMVDVSNVDNTLKGNQKVDISIDYEGMEINLSVGVVFRLPDKVTGVISLINELPEPENITFTNEEEIIIIENNIKSISDFYKGYIDNYDKFVECKSKLNDLYEEYITTEFTNERFILKTNLDNYFYSLDESDYSEENWELIIMIYDTSIYNLYLNENYSIIREIVTGAKLQIGKIKTLESINIENLRLDRVKDVVDYRNLLLQSDYSNANWLLLDDIEREYIEKLNNANNFDSIETLYNQAIDEFNKVNTILDEEELALGLLIESKIEEVKDIRLNIDLNNYSSTNRNLIASYYNQCLENIRVANNEEEINNEITKFINKVAIVKTIDEEESELLLKTRKEAIDEITAVRNSLNIYEYDSQNRSLIEGIFATALSKIEEATNVADINKTKTLAVEEIDSILTMEEQALINLPVKIQNAKNELDWYITNYNSSNYSVTNWSIIVGIIEDTKTWLDEEVTIITANKTIEEKIEKAKNDIDNVITIAEEQIEQLNNIRNTAINELDEYFGTLSEDDFQSAGIYALAQNRINEAKQTIHQLTDEQSINVLVYDIITAIEDSRI